MAEQEVIKHTKKICHIWNSKEHNFWHKLKEFVLSLSIWFHNLIEHSNQQEDVKQFLTGLKSDLQSDPEEAQNDRQSYLLQESAFSYITNIKLHDTLNNNSLRKYKNWMFNTTAINPNNGRFEGFKSAGKIGTIENTHLQNEIMVLYQEDIVSLLTSTDAYTDIKRKFFDYVIESRKRLTDSTSNMRTLLLQDEAQNIL